MGGVGGGYFSGRYSPADLSERIRQAEEATRDAEFEAEVAAFLGSQLADFNDRDVEGIRRILDNVEADLADETEATVDLLFGGSVAKHTYVDGLSDVDALVCVDESFASETPAELRSAFAERLRARYGAEAVWDGQLAVTLTVQGHRIQLLPAVRDGDRFKIGSPDGKKWASIRPKDFAEALNRANRRTAGKLVPTIKLAKAIISELPEQRRLTGYHVESLAINVFKGYKGETTPKAMLRHFFENAPMHVREPIRDRSGQSIHVDDYLGPAHSSARQVAADALGRIGTRIKNADAAKSMHFWQGLFPEGP